MRWKSIQTAHLRIELAKFCKINDRILHPLRCKGVWTEKFMIDWSFCEWSDFFLWNNLDYDELPINVYFLITLGIDLGKVTNNISLSNILLMAQFSLLLKDGQWLNKNFADKWHNFMKYLFLQICKHLVVQYCDENVLVIKFKSISLNK